MDLLQKPVSNKNLIEYNSNNLEGNGKENEPIDIEFTEQKAYPEIMKMLLILDDNYFSSRSRERNCSG